MEMADLMAINKADGDNKLRAQSAQREYQNALHLFPPPPSGWTPRVVTCSRDGETGIAEIWETVLEHAARSGATAISTAAPATGAALDAN